MTISKAGLLLAICGFVIGWLLLPLFIPFTLSPALVAGVLIVIVLGLRLIDRADNLWAVGGIVVGILVSLLIPSLALKAVDGYTLIWSVLFGLMFAYQI